MVTVSIVFLFYSVVGVLLVQPSSSTNGIVTLPRNPCRTMTQTARPAVSLRQICSTGAAAALHFRSATTRDVAQARLILFQEAMNPLSISAATLLVAEEEDEVAKDATSWNFLSTSMFKRRKTFVGFGQIRSLDDTRHYYELASLYVLPEYRRRGIGSALCHELLLRHETDQLNNRQLAVASNIATQKGRVSVDSGDYNYSNNAAVTHIAANSCTGVLLLTLQQTASFYEKFGFASVNMADTSNYLFLRSLPLSFQLEYRMGTVLSTLLNNQLICMIRPSLL